jgi:zona occludens toxin (predicted ATPase)
MRTMRGYCRRQARREVYKAYDVYKRGKNTHTSNEPVEVNSSDVVTAFVFLVGLYILVGWLIS